MKAHYGSLRFAEQIAFFAAKLNISTRSYLDLYGEQHNVAFMVAGAMQASLLSDLRDAVQSAIENGDMLSEFRDKFDEIVQRRGWSYRGTPGWRSTIIYETNLYTSYAAGRWRQIQEVKSRRPYLMSRHSDAVRDARPEHKAWDGLIVPADSEWAKTHVYPLGYGCKCRWYALNDRDLKSLGKDGPDEPPYPHDGTYTWTDPKTKKKHELPQGVDPGWDYVKGGDMSSELRKKIVASLPNLPAQIAADLSADLKLGMEPPNA